MNMKYEFGAQEGNRETPYNGKLTVIVMGTTRFETEKTSC